MIKFENTEVIGWEAAIRGMRNPMNSWEKSDSQYEFNDDEWPEYKVYPNDLELMTKLAAGGPVHAKYRRMILVTVDITAPLYWWKEYDTYKEDKAYWWDMIQLLPSSYNQKRTVLLNYEVLSGIYQMRMNHKLDEWRELCKWIETLPYAKDIIIKEELK